MLLSTEPATGHHLESSSQAVTHFPKELALRLKNGLEKAVFPCLFLFHVNDDSCLVLCSSHSIFLTAVSFACHPSALPAALEKVVLSQLNVNQGLIISVSLSSLF